MQAPPTVRLPPAFGRLRLPSPKPRPAGLSECLCSSQLKAAALELRARYRGTRSSAPRRRRVPAAGPSPRGRRGPAKLGGGPPSSKMAQLGLRKKVAGIHGADVQGAPGCHHSGTGSHGADGSRSPTLARSCGLPAEAEAASLARRAPAHAPPGPPAPGRGGSHAPSAAAAAQRSGDLGARDRSKQARATATVPVTGRLAGGPPI
jgi:hypothetical protein